MRRVTTQRQFSEVDHLRRSREDGAYHCPECNYPFTRRSNLRRHYVIHTRNTEHRCHICNVILPSKADLDSHLQLNYCWPNSGTGASNTGNDIDLIGEAGLTSYSPLSQSSPASDGASTPYHQSDLYPSPLVSPISMEGHTNLDLLAAVPPASTPSFIDFPLPPLEQEQEIWPQDPSFHAPFVSRYQQGQFDRNSWHETYPESEYSLGGRNRRFASREGRGRPVYSQRQVEDMMNMVSNVFLNQMGTLIQRTNSGSRQRG